MSKDTWAIIGAMGIFGATLVGLGAVGFNQIGSRLDDLRNDMNVDNLRTDIRELRTDVRQTTDRLRNVEIAFGKVDQRLLTIERALIPAAEPR